MSQDDAGRRLAEAQAHMLAGRLAEAREALEQAAAQHTTPADRARALGLSATILRLDGDAIGAGRRAREAIALAPPDSPAALAARREAGDAALASGRPREAGRHYATALAQATDAPTRADLSLRRTRALAAAGEFDAALAATLNHPQGGLTPLRVVEGAGALHAAGALEHADALLERAREGADDATLAAVELLAAAQALARGDLQAAQTAAEAARQHALDAVDPGAYVSAAVVLSELAERRGDRTNAYAPLATGWMTLADLLGREQAQAVFAPLLSERRERWGAEAFAAAKAAYETG